MLFKIKAVKKSKRYEIRLTEEERSELQKRADASNLELSKYLIRCGLGRPISTSNTSDLVLELMSLGKIQRELYSGDQQNKQPYLDILIAIVAAIRSIPYRIAKTKSKVAYPDRIFFHKYDKNHSCLFHTKAAIDCDKPLLYIAFGQKHSTTLILSD